MLYQKRSAFHLVLALVLAAGGSMGVVEVQAQVQARFAGPALDPGWRLAGGATMTAPAVDPAGNGWLRLTGNANSAFGAAFYTGAPFSAAKGVTVSFAYTSWGGGAPGADGISVFLHDGASNMAGALGGGALGYCRGQGGWLGLALDEYGNFSNPAIGCGGGPGRAPQSVVLRGPTPAGNPFQAGAAAPGGIDSPAAQTRPAAGQVALRLVPKPAGPGFNVTVDWRAGPTAAWTRLLDKVDFPHAAPDALRLGVAGSTGGAKNIHEVRDLSVLVHRPPTVTQSFDPPEVAAGRKSTWTLSLGSSDNTAATLVEPFTHRFGPGVRVAQPAAIGGTCPALVRAIPGSDSLTLEAGTMVRPAGCTVTVEVIVAGPGAFPSTVAAGALVTNNGQNLQPVTATVSAR
jgi:hypothetical protein